MNLTLPLLKNVLFSNRERLIRLSTERKRLQNLFINIANDFYNKFVEEELEEEIYEAGAKPVESLTTPKNASLPFHPFTQTFKDVSSATSWADEVLRGHEVGAVDGSHLTPFSLHGLPLGFVRVGWYLNLHRDSLFEKGSELKLVLPEENTVYMTESKINFERTYGELNKIKSLIKAISKDSQEEALLFFDGSFVFSFAEHLGEKEKEKYRAVLKDIFTLSKRHKVAVVGFVDNSLAHDFTNTLLNFQKKLKEVDAFNVLPLPDSLLFDGVLTKWGERSPVFLCLRKGIISEKEQDNFNIHFCYIKTGMSTPPCRIEFPTWLFEEGLVDQMVFLVLAQCVVGRGYPLVLKKAHDYSVITAKDRERIVHALFRLIKEEQIAISPSRKSILKES